MQPILVRPVDGGRFEIIAGERRWRAAQRAGLTEIPALVRAVPDQSALALALIENIQREDLNPLEEAHGLQRLIDEFGLDARRRGEGGRPLAQRGDQPAAPARAREAGAGISAGGRARHGSRARAARPGRGAADRGRAARVVAQGLSVRETERLVHAMAHPAQAQGEAHRACADPDLARLQNELAEALGAKVAIEAKAGGAGRVVIRYSSLEQLDGIIARLRLT